MPANEAQKYLVYTLTVKYKQALNPKLLYRHLYFISN